MKSSTSERLIAVVSAFLAVGILGVFVVAERAGQRPGVNLPALEADVRMQFDLALRSDLPAYEARTAALEAAIDAFLASKRTPGDETLLAEWFEQAIQSTMPGLVMPLPATPQFGVALKTPIAKPSVAQTDPALPEQPAGPHGGDAQTVDPSVESPVVETPAAAVSQVALTDPISMPASSDELAPADPPAPVSGTDDVLPPAAEPMSRPPVAGPVPDLAEPPANEIAIVAVEVTETSPVSTPVVTASEAVEVNLAELRARVAGYHAGLRDVAASLTHVEGQLSLPAAETAVDELQRLADLHEFLQLYYDSLTPGEAARVSSPQSPVATARRVEAALQNATLAQDGDFDPFDAAAAEPLARLRQRVRTIVDRSSGL